MDKILTSEQIAKASRKFASACKERVAAEAQMAAADATASPNMTAEETRLYAAAVLRLTKSQLKFFETAHVAQEFLNKLYPA